MLFRQKAKTYCKDTIDDKQPDIIIHKTNFKKRKKSSNYGIYKRNYHVTSTLS